MAFGLMDVFVKIGADTSDLKQGINDSKGLVSGLGDGLKGAVSGGIKMVGSAVAGATAAVGAFAASSVRVGSNFDSSMAQVAATMGKTVDEIGDLRQFAQDMGATTAFSATQAADALNFMALAGYDADQSMQMLPNVLNLAAAGDMELARASDMVTDAQTALGLSFEETSTMVDMMAKASSQSNTSVSQLGDAILTIGGTAKNMAGGTLELTTALGILADNGIKGSEAGTHLRNMILSLSAPTDNAAAMIEELGIKTKDAEGNLLPIQNIMGQLGASIDGLGTAERAEVISTIFNKTDISSVNALLDTTDERWTELGDAIDDSAGAAQKMAETQLDNLAGDVTLFKSALEGAQILVSDQLTPTLRKFVQFGTDGLTKVSEAFKEGGLSGAMEAFGTVLSDGLNMVISELPAMIDAGMQLLGALGQGLLDNLPVIIDATVQIANQILTGIVQALPLMAEGAVQIVTGLANGIAEMLPNLIPTIVQVVMEIVETLIENAPLLVDAAFQLLQGLADGILNAIPVIIDMAPKIIDSLVKALVTNIPQMIQGAISLVEKIVTALPTIIQSLVNALPTVINAIVNGLLTAVPQLIQGHIKMTMALVKAMPQIIKALVDAMPTVIQTLLDAITNNLPMIIDAFIDLTGQIVSALPQITMALLQAVPTIVSSIAKAILTAAPAIFDAVVTILTTVGSKLAEKGSEFVSTTGEKMSELYDKFIEWLSKLPERMAYWAGFAVGRFITFLSELPGKAKTQFDNTMSKLKEFAEDFIKKAKETGEEFVNKIMEKIKELPGKIKDIGSDMLEAIKDLPDKFKSLGHDMINGLITGIGEKAEDLKNKIIGIFKSGYEAGKEYLQVNSPSKLYMKLGRGIDEGLQVGIERSTEDVSRAMDSLLDVVDIPDISPSFNVGSAEGIGLTTASIYDTESLTIPNMVDAFVKALDKYGLTVEIDNRELGRVVRREVLA